MNKEKIVIVGSKNWIVARIVLLEALERCETESDFIDLVANIAGSIGTPTELINNRKKLGLKAFTKDELKLMRGKK